MDETETDLFQKLNLETAKINWQELERFFASGNLVLVDESLDLVKVGVKIAQDDKASITEWMNKQALRPVDDQLARQWQGEQTTFWALVIKPWVLIQKS
jgi:hypothetical protein